MRTSTISTDMTLPSQQLERNSKQRKINLLRLFYLLYFCHLSSQLIANDHNQFIKAVEEKEKDQSYFKNLSFTSFLITPVQRYLTSRQAWRILVLALTYMIFRIPRYVLLLKDLLKNTPEVCSGDIYVTFLR